MAQAKHRFSEVFEPRAHSAVENVPLARTPNVVALPTLGMILPNWFVLVPREHSLNIAAQSATVRSEMIALVAELHSRVARANDRFVIFEHGPTVAGTKVGCGVDHAHLHVLFGSASTIDSVWRGIANELAGSPSAVALTDLHSGLVKDQPYYLAWKDGERIVEQPAKEVSQRLRRVVAEAAGCPEMWDYKAFPFYENISATIAGVRNEARRAA